ncbi:hypothetical protein EVAR_90367_1 [Eumeta japonica]|uniref:Uncharacterized protein n=1 Tax=Eumeta variegata TaxID=151549 RepID=A0A4C1YB63_EUMVA|nr:hypothetical protein EVAR_90367_1 [Eumeta japonica]
MHPLSGFGIQDRKLNTWAEEQVRLFDQFIKLSVEEFYIHLASRRLSLVRPLPPAAAEPRSVVPPLATPLVPGASAAAGRCSQSEAHGASPGCAVYPGALVATARCYRSLLQNAVRDVTPDHLLLPPLLTIRNPCRLHRPPDARTSSTCAATPVRAF